MRRSCSAHALCVVLLLASASCGGGVELSLQLRPASDIVTGDLFDTSVLTSLHVFVKSAAGKEDDQRITIDRKNQVDLDPLAIDKTKPLTLDVWGCANPIACESADVVFRGCTPRELDFSKRKGTIVVDLEMFPVNDNRLSACPAL